VIWGIPYFFIKLPLVVGARSVIGFILILAGSWLATATSPSQSQPVEVKAS
jgi:hypothetical protein